jgi:hypothetical protein
LTQRLFRRPLSPVAKDDDDILLPKKKKAVPLKPASGSSGSGPSAPMLRLIRITRGLGLVIGGLVTMVGVMGIVGLVTGNLLARFLVALVLVIGIPALATDRLLKRTKARGLGLVGDVFAIVLLGLALFFVGLEFLSKPLFVGEGDHYARSGSRGMSRFAYWLGGVTPVFPEERGLSRTIQAGALAAPSASASASAGAADGGAR